MTDTDRMPFGKHKNEKMANVPASYLLWIRHTMFNNQLVKDNPLSEYIEENLETFKEEIKSQTHD